MIYVRSDDNTKIHCSVDTIYDDDRRYVMTRFASVGVGSGRADRGKKQT